LTCCRQPADAASEDLETGEPDERAVSGEIASPKLARLHQQSPEPLKSDCLDPDRRALDESGQHVEASAYADNHRHLQTLAVALAPGLFERAGHANEQQVGFARPYLFDDACVIVRAEIAVAEAGNVQFGELRSGPLHKLRDHLAPGAKEVDAQAILPGG